MAVGLRPRPTQKIPEVAMSAVGFPGPFPGQCLIYVPGLGGITLKPQADGNVLVEAASTWPPYQLPAAALEQIILLVWPATPGWEVVPTPDSDVPPCMTPVVGWALTAASPATPVPVTVFGIALEPADLLLNGQSVGRRGAKR
jgi:hypothetical protein